MKLVLAALASHIRLAAEWVGVIAIILAATLDAAWVALVLWLTFA